MIQTFMHYNKRYERSIRLPLLGFHESGFYLLPPSDGTVSDSFSWPNKIEKMKVKKSFPVVFLIFSQCMSLLPGQ